MSDLHVIDDSTPARDLYHPSLVGGRGLELPPPGERSYAGLAEPFPTELIIPRSEWQSRIEERQRRRATNRDRLRYHGVRVKSQNETNYCWINAPTFCVEGTRASQGQGYTPLSPASAGAQIKNYRNVGGWGREGLEWIVKYGLAPESLWPANAIDPRYATPSTLAAMRNYRADEWWVLDNRDLDQLVSCLLRGFMAAVGYSWWGHEVTAVDPVWMDGTAALLFANSWGESYGDEGYAVIQGNRMLPDDCVAPRTAIAA